MRAEMGTINIGKNYRIGADATNIVLYERFVNIQGENKGKERWDDAGYFSTVGHALNFLVEHEVKKTELKDLSSVVAKIDEVKAWIHALNLTTNITSPVGRS